MLPNSPPSMEGATPLAAVVLIQAGALACWWLCGGVGGGLWAWRCDRDGVMEEWCTVPTYSRSANWTNWHHPITPSRGPSIIKWCVRVMSPSRRTSQSTTRLRAGRGVGGGRCARARASATRDGRDGAATHGENRAPRGGCEWSLSPPEREGARRSPESRPPEQLSAVRRRAAGKVPRRSTAHAASRTGLR